MLKLPPNSQRICAWATAPIALFVALHVTAGTPNAPQNANSVVYSDTAGELFWNRVEDADGIAGYRVYRNGDLLQQLSGSSLFLEGLTPATTYTFNITAIDSLGNESALSPNTFLRTNQQTGSVSSPVDNTPAFTPEPESTAQVVTGNLPAAPQNARAESYSNTAAELFWDRVSSGNGIAAYRVYLNDQLLQEVPGTSLFLDNLSPSTSYLFSFSSVNTRGVESARSRNYQFRIGSPLLADSPAVDTSQPTPPVSTAPVTVDTSPVTVGTDVPRNLATTGTTESTISVSWLQPAATADYGYNVYLNGAYADTTFSTNYVFSGLSADTSYVITATAFDSNSNFSSSSEPLQVSTSSASLQPENPAQQTTPNQTPIVPQTSNGPDFFGATLEIDNEVPSAGGPPTAPKNLRANLIGNDWAELNWAPSRDDGAVVSYRIYRSDGVVYNVAGATANSGGTTARVLQNYLDTTTLIDCNFTHISLCSSDATTPAVGSTHTYQVTAIDNAGNESARSNALTVRYHQASGATIERFSDPYIDPSDNFMFVTDLSNTANFIDQFDTVFQDEFNGSEIDPAKWTTRLTFAQEDQNIINGELQYFVDTQSDPDFGYNPFVMTGETLKISAIKTPPELLDRALGQPFLSGSLSSHEVSSGQTDANGTIIPDKFATTYGYVEGRIRVGQVSGMLTSFFLFRRWEAEHSPEIDILEYLGENPFGEEKAFQTYHYRDVVHGNTLSSPTMFYPRESGTLGSQKDLDGFHTYGVLWEPNLVIWYIDGEEVQRLTGPQISRQSMNIILYLVTGSDWAPRPADNAPYPLEMEIDYVRAYKRRPG